MSPHTKRVLGLLSAVVLAIACFFAQAPRANEGCVLSGRIVTSEGAIIARAAIDTRSRRGDLLDNPTETDGAGSFHVSTAADGAVLTIKKEGYATLRRFVRDCTPVDIIVERPGAVRGIVTDREGHPVTATVTLVSRHRHNIVTTGTLTNTDGAFDFADVLPSTAALVVTAAGFAPETRRIDLSAGDVARLSVALTASASLMVRVMDESGEPVEGAHVEVEYPSELEGRTLAAIVNRQISEHTDGNYYVPGIIPETQVRVRVSAGTAQSALEGVSVRSREERFLAVTIR